MKNLEQPARLVVGLSLAILSAIFTIGLFLTLAGDDPVRRGIMGTLALMLEAAKVLTWRMGGHSRALAIALIGLSGLASLGAALETVEAHRLHKAERQRPQLEAGTAYSLQRSEVDLIDQELTALTKRLEGLPSDFTTAAANLVTQLERLREKRSVAASRLSAAEAPTLTMFDLLGGVIGAPPDDVELAILLSLSVCLEWAALTLTGSLNLAPAEEVPRPGIQVAYETPEGKPKAVRKTQFRRTRKTTPERYAEIAHSLGRNGHPAGYRTVRDKLKLPDRVARELVAEARAQGLV